jgi:hypothetical protein
LSSYDATHPTQITLKFPFAACTLPEIDSNKRGGLEETNYLIELEVNFLNYENRGGVS